MKALPREQIVAEVLELGEMLFDTIIEVTTQQSVGENEKDAVLIEEMRMAADEYFVALRLLLGMKRA